MHPFVVHQKEKILRVVASIFCLFCMVWSKESTSTHLFLRDQKKNSLGIDASIFPLYCRVQLNRSSLMNPFLIHQNKKVWGLLHQISLQYSLFKRVELNAPLFHTSEEEKFWVDAPNFPLYYTVPTKESSSMHP